MNYAEKDKRYVWHPFTQMKDWIAGENLMIERGEGVWLYDTCGKKYLDGVSSLWVNVHGHCRRELNEAIKDQMDKISHTTYLGLGHPLASDLAEKLVQISPDGLQKVFYSDNGSTAMEVAMKIAYQYWQQKDNGKFFKKKKFVSFKEAYHGDTIGSVSLGGIDLFHEVYGALLFDTYKVPYPYSYRFEHDEIGCGEFCLDRLEEVLKEKSDEIAGIVIEPEVQGASGMIMTSPGFMKGVEKLARKYSVLLICDEVAVGFGRTGEMFASDIENIKPDIMSVAKSITGGYLPLAATLTTDEVFEAFLGDYSEKKTFFHGHTYTANPLGCAVAMVSLKLFEQDKLIEKIKTRAIESESLLKRTSELDHVGNIRQKGLMFGLELVRDKITKEPYDWSERIGVKVINEARKCGVIIRPLGNVVVMMPPLCITKDELVYLMDAVYKSIKTVTE